MQNKMKFGQFYWRHIKFDRKLSGLENETCGQTSTLCVHFVHFLQGRNKTRIVWDVSRMSKRNPVLKKNHKFVYIMCDRLCFISEITWWILKKFGIRSTLKVVGRIHFCYLHVCVIYLHEAQIRFDRILLKTAVIQNITTGRKYSSCWG
jgi:hypothetical protein